MLALLQLVALLSICRQSPWSVLTPYACYIVVLHTNILSWSTQEEIVCKKVNSMLGTIRCAGSRATANVCDHLFTALVMLRLLYCLPVWGNCNETAIHIFNNCVQKALHTITGPGDSTAGLSKASYQAYGLLAYHSLLLLSYHSLLLLSYHSLLLLSYHSLLLFSYHLLLLFSYHLLLLFSYHSLLLFSYHSLLLLSYHSLLLLSNVRLVYRLFHSDLLLIKTKFALSLLSGRNTCGSGSFKLKLVNVKKSTNKLCFSVGTAIHWNYWPF